MSRAFYTKAYTKANDTVVPQAQMLSYHMHECVCRNSPSSQAGTLMVGAWSWTLIGTNPVASIVGARTVPLIVPWLARFCCKYYASTELVENHNLSWTVRHNFS